MKNNKTNYRIFSADFETTSYSGQTKTEVWAAACVEIGTEDVEIFHSIIEQYEFFEEQKSFVHFPIVYNGKLNLILDNLIAEGKCEEMIAVVCCGYAFQKGKKDE